MWIVHFCYRVIPSFLTKKLIFVSKTRVEVGTPLSNEKSRRFLGFCVGVEDVGGYSLCLKRFPFN